MKISYRKESDHDYMVIEDIAVDTDAFALQMQERNEIAYFLPMQVYIFNGLQQLQYRTTGLTSLEQLFSQKDMKKHDVEMVFRGLQGIVRETEQYLLCMDDVLFDPKTIYVNMSVQQMYVCVVPDIGHNRPEDMKLICLAEFILKHLDHADRVAVRMAYQFYQEVARQKDDIRLSNILEILQERESVSKDFAIDGDEHADSIYDDVQKSGRHRNEEQRDQNNIEMIRGVGPDHHSGQKDKKQNKERKRKEKEHTVNIKRMILLSAVTVGLAAVNVVGYFLWVTDLTQMAGMIFLSIVILWWLLKVTAVKKKKTENLWVTDHTQADDIDLGELFSEIYDDDLQGKVDEVDATSLSENTKYRKLKENVDDTKEIEKNRYAVKESEIKAAGETAETEYGGDDAYDGMTRCIILEEENDQPCLSCKENGSYEDIILSAQRLIIGKTQESADRVIKAPQISRYHACVDAEQGEYFLSDLNSRNGTWLNGVRLQPFVKHFLHDGDEISFADIIYIAKNI